MPNALTAQGLTTATREELIDYYSAEFRRIYGSDVNLESDTPDGQWVNIQVQAVLDIQDLLAEIYNSFDPDLAFGVVLDQRVAINGIQRQAGTYTITPITLINSQSVNLYGLDGVGSTPDVREDGEEIFRISDNAGNEWLLEDTQLGLAANTHVLNFRAALPGQVLTIPNTINIPLTIVVGVTSVNNPSTYSTLGINEELDAQLKIRRQRSVSLASQGYNAGLRAALLNINGVTSAFVYENDTDSTDSDGTPAHTIWVIVAGTGTDELIAQAIYTKRNAGAGMRGDESYIVLQDDGTPFVVRWDEVLNRNVFIKMTLTSIDGVVAPGVSAIREGLVENYQPGVNQNLNINAVATAVQQIDPNALVTNEGLSDGTDQELTLSGVPASGSFKILYNGEESAAIDWDDSVGAIQTIIQDVTGLSNTTVTGSLAGQSLEFDLSDESNVLGLISVVDNSLETSGPVDITFGYVQNYVDVLNAPTKRDQFILSVPNIILLPMQLNPSLASVQAEAMRQFQAAGGYGDYLYEITVNNSGGSIDPDTGLYTAGATPAVTDTIRATDAFGNTATAMATVF